MGLLHVAQAGPRKQGCGESKTSVRRLEARDRALKALELRKRGKGWDEIAEQSGFASKQAAFGAVTALLKQTAQEPADQVRALEVERLDMLLNKALKGVDRGDVTFFNVCLRIMDRRAKLLGLDAPVRTELTGQGGQPLLVTVSYGPAEAGKPFAEVLAIEEAASQP